MGGNRNGHQCLVLGMLVLLLPFIPGNKYVAILATCKKSLRISKSSFLSVCTMCLPAAETDQTVRVTL